MIKDTPARDFLRPAMLALLTQAGQRGIARDVAVAVIIDLMTGPEFNQVEIDPGEDTPPAHPSAFPMEVHEVAQAEAEAMRANQMGANAARGRRGPLLPRR